MLENLKPTLQPYMDQTTSYNESDYVIIGVPMDLTASYRGGTNKAPDAIRKESICLESYSPRTGLDLEDIKLCDHGDIKADDYYDWVNQIEQVASQIANDGKIPILLGGEHSITLGALRALKPDLVISFDAHMDLREELFDERDSHATFMRHAFEEQDFKLVLIGGRAFSQQELIYLEENRDRIKLISAQEILNGAHETMESLSKWFEQSSRTYLTVDMDVLDPSQAPAVGNPSPEGINVTQLMNHIHELVDSKLVGFDINEVSPSYDTGLTSINAAYILLETIYAIDKSKRIS